MGRYIVCIVGGIPLLQIIEQPSIVAQLSRRVVCRVVVRKSLCCPLSYFFVYSTSNVSIDIIIVFYGISLIG